MPPLPRVWRRTLFRLIALSLGLAVAVLLIETAAHLRERSLGASEHISRWTFRASRPAPYHDANYYCDAFLLESMRSHQFVRPGDAPFVIPVNFRGRWINIREHRRATSDQPEAPDRRVLLFGGSTALCLEVPDEWTLASCLQRALNRRSSQRWRVENFGTSSMIARQQTARLLREQVRPGDVALFYDGVNDVLYPVYNGNPHGWLPGDSHEGGTRRLNALERRVMPLCLSLGRYSATARFLQHRIDARPPDNIRRDRSFTRNLNAAEQGFLEALRSAEKHVRAHSGSFLHALQPHLFLLSRPTEYEHRVRENDLKLLPGLDHAFAEAYPRLRRALRAFTRAGGRSIDLSGILDDRDPASEVYLDFCHVNHVANERIASELCRHVLDIPPRNGGRP